MHGRRPTIASMHGIVAAAHPLAAQAGAKLLGAGGNAFDAAAATAAALGVVEPFMSSLAGMGLATCWVASEKRVRTLDFVTRVPVKFPVDRFSKREDLARGPLSVGAPGNMAGWAELVKTHGKKSLAEVLAPAIALAADGFPLVEFGEHEINLTTPDIKAHPTLYEQWAKTYLSGKGAARVGQVLRQPDLARSMESIAAHGTKALYSGALGRTIVEHLGKLGGCLSMADLEAVKPTWNDPVTANYRGLTINVPPPPCEGFQYLLTMRILDGFQICRMDRLGLEQLDTVWRAIRISAGVRIANNFADRDRVLELLSEESVEKLRARVRDGKPIEGPTEQWMEPPREQARESHTTSMSVADRFGNVVCITNSIGSPFGSGVVVPGTGIILNNFLYWADVSPKSPNLTKPGAWLPMCVSPSLGLKGDKCVLALGTPGSYGIKQTQAQALVQYADYGLPLQDAIEAPRARLWDGRRVDIETRLSSDVIEGLKARGHQIVCTEEWTMRVGGMQGIAIDSETGAMTGACDPRRDGYVATG